MDNSSTIDRHSIPEEAKADVPQQLNPFTDAPSLDTVLFDIHTNSSFKVRDYLAIREGDLNFLAAPRYAEAGGTVSNWVALPDDDDTTDTPFPLMAKTIKGTLRTGVNTSQKVVTSLL